MNPPTALIAEDEALLAAGLRADLARLWPELQVVAMAEDGRSALQQALALRPAVCFLDIRMPAMSGLEVAQALAEDWPDEASAPFPLLVFVTAYDHHAIEAFDAQAADYLLKPVDGRRLEACVGRLQRSLASRGGAAAELELSLQRLRALLGSEAAPRDARLQVIQAQVGNTVHLVPLDEVIYFEAADKYLRVVTAEREHLIRMSLRELVPQLDPGRFWQVHRGTVVQARCIASARRDESGKAYLTLRGRPEQITVSRLYAPRFKGM